MLPLKPRDINQAIISTLLYFDNFNYPLNGKELLKYLSVKSTDEKVSSHLDSLATNKVIKAKQGYFGVNGSLDELEKRLDSNQLAQSLMPKARKMANFIGSFPFVRSVSLSGTISKGVMHEDSDMDFFIITKQGRLWVSKFLLVMYKRLFLNNSRKYFCINYFISENDLAIEDKNIFTAIELATLIPVYGAAHYKSLMSQNNWLRELFPNWTNQDKLNNIDDKKKPIWSVFIEKILAGGIGAALDRKIMKRVQKSNKRKYGKDDHPDFELMFRSTPTQSKVHNSNYQRVLVKKYEQKCSDFFTSLGDKQINNA